MAKKMAMAERLIATLDAATKIEFPALSTCDGVRRVLVKDVIHENIRTYRIREDYRDEDSSEFFQGVSIIKSEDGVRFLTWFGDAPCVSVGAYSLETEGEANAILEFLRIAKHIKLSA